MSSPKILPSVQTLLTNLLTIDDMMDLHDNVLVDSDKQHLFTNIIVIYSDLLFLVWFFICLLVRIILIVCQTQGYAALDRCIVDRELSLAFCASLLSQDQSVQLSPPLSSLCLSFTHKSLSLTPNHLSNGGPKSTYPGFCLSVMNTNCLFASWVAVSLCKLRLSPESICS